MTVSLAAAALHLAVATGCGAVIGIERQLRRRKAGLRTNALVALGAAAFVTFSALVPNEVSPTRVAAQVVSGIGFLGAGIIFRDGLNVQGLTTAATLWCAAAVGLLAGIGAWPYALLATGFVVFINFALRPLVQVMKRRIGAAVPARNFRLVVRAPAPAEGEARALYLRALAPEGLHLTGMDRQAEADEVVLVARVQGDSEAEEALEQALQRLAAEPGLVSLHWEAANPG